jgi:hypothetical protein
VLIIPLENFGYKYPVFNKRRILCWLQNRWEKLKKVANKNLKAKKCVEIWSLHSSLLLICWSFLPITFSRYICFQLFEEYYLATFCWLIPSSCKEPPPPLKLGCVECPNQLVKYRVLLLHTPDELAEYYASHSIFPSHGDFGIFMQGIKFSYIYPDPEPAFY